MTQTVTLEDGSVHNFPDDATPNEMNSMLPAFGGSQAQASSQKMPGEDFFRQLGLTGRYLAGAVPETLTGMADTVNAPVNSVTSLMNKYGGTNIPQLGTNMTDAVEKKLTEQGFPEPQKGMESAVAVPSKILAGFMTGGEGAYNTGKEMAGNATDMLTNLIAKQQGPATSAHAKAIASNLYAQAHAAGGQLTPEFTNSFINEARSLAPQSPEGALFAGDTPITNVVKKTELLAGKPISLQGAQEIDEHLGNLIDKEYGLKGLSKDGKQLLNLQSTFRNMIEDAQPEHVVGGTEGFDAIKEGRKAWSQAAKMQDIERIATRASMSDNPATTIKSGVRTLLSNPSRIRGYSKDEIDALKAAGNRGLLGGTLHVFGNRLLPLGAGLLGEQVGGPGAAAAFAAAAHAGSTAMRSGATALQGSRLQNVLQTLGNNIGAQ